ncbi:MULTISPECIES: ABC transporter substrate-binding protein [unclassified Oceanispirochaeta]|uniref:ABC transporter substrate-binding protein n=1 Tax=unclassified Oceanispirochaeta TaxID=2635722 RepID=UPI000E091B9B|nr:MULTISPECIES: ABC transporter substrate-binding protein [unclassified Oceanispirochaeta]MBF9014602.1 ABC transporter substrate-binding protein [Oceanispirochaeta sp. M2]NPD70858.1 ABC transporter substrate-binding protein [Oceanispirochaeta sp. M1]RDG34138.1 DUF3502 domain-containing protein [Oceanispirochaeta sp. M1]
MKRMASALICLIFLVAALPVMAGGQGEDGAAAEAVELVWYVPGGSGFPYGPDDEKEVYAQLNNMIQRDLGFSVDIRATGGFGEYRETMPLAMAAGEDFDLVWTSSWCNNFMDAASDGYYAGLDELLPEYAPTIWKDTRDALESTRMNGEIRGVWSQQIAAKTSNVFLRESMIEKYGWDLDSIKEVEDLEPLLTQIKREDPDLIPLSMRKPLPEWMIYDLGYGDLGVLVDLLAIRLDDKSCQVFSLIEDPGYKNKIELARDWYAKGFIPKDGLTYNMDQWNQMVNAGKVGMKLHNTWIPGKDRVTTAFDDTWVQIPFDGPSVMQGGNIVSTLNAVSARSEHQVEAVRLLEYLWTNEEAFNLLAWGIEGTHYNLKGDFIEPLQDGGYYANIPWVFGNTFISYLREGENPEANEMIYKLNQDAVKSPLMGFSLDMDSIKTLVATVSSVHEQYYKAVCGGYVGDDVYEEYVAALKQAGIDELIEGIQDQIDSWTASK